VAGIANGVFAFDGVQVRRVDRREDVFNEHLARSRFARLDLDYFHGFGRNAILTVNNGFRHTNGFCSC